MRKTFALCLISLSLLFITVAPVQAAEITPDPASYNYGSTSEHSPATTVGDQAELAETGDPFQVLLLLATTALVLGGALLVYRRFSRQR